MTWRGQASWTLKLAKWIGCPMSEWIKEFCLFVCLFLYRQSSAFISLSSTHVLFWTTGAHSVQRAFPMSIFVAATAETRTPTGAPRSDRACLMALRWNINILDGHTSWSRGYSIACWPTRPYRVTLTAAKNRVPNAQGKQGKCQKRNYVRGNTGNLKILPKHREFGLLKL